MALLDSGAVAPAPIVARTGQRAVCCMYAATRYRTRAGSPERNPSARLRAAADGLVSSDLVGDDAREAEDERVGPHRQMAIRERSDLVRATSSAAMPSSTSPARRPTVDLVNMPIENKRRAERQCDPRRLADVEVVCRRVTDHVRLSRLHGRVVVVVVDRDRRRLIYA
jgi:hypothetical protein